MFFIRLRPFRDSCLAEGFPLMLFMCKGQQPQIRSGLMGCSAGKPELIDDDFKQ